MRKLRLGCEKDISYFENGIERHRMIMRQEVSSCGYFLLHEKGYSYTVGFKDCGYPELILYDGGKELAESFFCSLYSAARQGRALSDLEEIGTFISFRPTVTPIDDLEKRRHFFATRIYHGDWNFSAARVSTGLEQRIETCGAC